MFSSSTLHKLTRITLAFALGITLLSAQTRIVSTTPSITEILFALGLGDRVAGVSTYCRYPPQALKIAKIGTFIDPNIEAILEKKPDLVIVQKNPIRLTERLQAVKLHVLEVNPVSMDGVYQAIAAIAEAAAIPAKGQALITSIRANLAQVRERTRQLPKPKVIFIVGRTPGTLDGLIAAARGSYLSELLETSGGQNVFADSPTAYPKISHEELIARNPGIVIDMGDSTHTGVISEEHGRAVVQLWSRFRNLSAVRNKRVYAVADDRFVVPGPRMSEAVRLFGKMLHPEVRW